MTEVFVRLHFRIVILALFSLTVIGTSSVQTPFDTISSLQLNHVVWAQTPEIFPNSTTTAILGNRSLIPGIHVMSLVNDIKSTWLIISSDNELSVNIRYEGTGNVTAPAVSLLATALKTSSSAPQLPSNATFERLTGTNITQAGWTSPITVALPLQGSLSLYDADLIVVMIVPYTGPSLTNSTTTVLPQNQT